MSDGLTRHLVAVWNPSYAKNAMEEHLAVLLEHAERMRRSPHAADDAYVWWGRVQSVNRRDPLAHLEDIRAIDARLGEDDPPETHVYLTDYQSLYVADLAEIHFGELPAGESSHVPRYYGTDGLSCDFWLKLWDIRRLVTNDNLATIEELKRLRNVHYHGRPVSLYGGMVDLPLVVTRPEEVRFFDPDERDVATDAALWAEFDAELGVGLASVERAIRDDMIGDVAWRALEPAVRNFVATGEKVYRDRRNDPSFDFAPVLGSFSKAIEVQLNGMLRRVLPNVPSQARMLNVDGASMDLAKQGSFMLRDLVRVLNDDERRVAALTGLLVNGQWLTGPFAAVLDEFRATRNDGIHERRIDRRTATLWRNQLLGVGCIGHFVELAKVRPRASQ